MTLLPQDSVRATARELYEQGLALDAIARSVKTSVVTLLRWRRDDEKQGQPWLRPGEPAPTDKMRLKLQQHLAALIDEAGKRKDKGRERYPTLEDRMLKTCRIIENLTPDTDDPAVQLAVLKRFAVFCVHHLTEDEMGPVRKAVRLFLDDLKASHQ